MPIATPLTGLLGIKHPIMLAPMDLIAGARLTGAVIEAGGSVSSAVATATRRGSRRRPRS